MTSARRQAYLDRVRGLAVLIMIEAHVLDSWTRVADRSHPGFGYAMMLGGFGAPLFLFLAGVAVVLSAESKFRKTGDFSAAWRAVQKRGWQVFGLAFLFRLQSYILSGGYSALSLLKVDILNVMGPAIAMAAIAGGAVKTRAARAVRVCCRSRRDRDADADRADHALLELAARPGRVVFPSVPGPHQFHTVSLGRFRLCRRRDWHLHRPPQDCATRTGGSQIGLAAAAVLLAVPRLPGLVSPVDLCQIRVLDELTVVLLPSGRASSRCCIPLAYFWEQAPWRRKVSIWSPLEDALAGHRCSSIGFTSRWSTASSAGRCAGA